MLVFWISESFHVEQILEDEFEIRNFPDCYLNLKDLNFECKDRSTWNKKSKEVNSENCLKRFPENNKTKCF